MVVATFAGLIILLTLSLFLFQDKLIFYPEVLPQDFNFSFQHQFGEIDFQVAEDVRINALHFKTDLAKGVVFYSHGNAGSLRNWGSIADIFLELGYDLLIYDYRGYGKSGGSISEENLYHDAEVIYRELLKLYDQSRIIVYGRSIGTGIAAKIAAEHEPAKLILESPFYSLPDLIKRIFPFIPSVLIKYKFRNDLMIKLVKCPVFIFHGTADEVIYFESSVKLKMLLKEKDRLIPVEGGHHNDLDEFDIYHYELKQILN